MVDLISVPIGKTKSKGSESSIYSAKYLEPMLNSKQKKEDKLSEVDATSCNM